MFTITEHSIDNLVSSIIIRSMNHKQVKEPTLRTWLRLNNKLDQINIGQIQTRRVRQLQIQEALKCPQWFSF